MHSRQLDRIHNSFFRCRKKYRKNRIYPAGLTRDLYNRDPGQAVRLITVYFKRITREWERVLAARGPEEKSSVEVMSLLFIVARKYNVIYSFSLFKPLNYFSINN